MAATLFCFVFFFPQVKQYASSIRNMKKDHTKILQAQDLKISSIKLANYVMLKICYKYGPRLVFGSNAGCSNEENIKKPLMLKSFLLLNTNVKTLL